MHNAAVVMRLMAVTIDGDGMEPFVFEQEEVVSNAPVIKVLELEDKSWVFELWADKIKLFGAQDLISCLVSSI